MSKRNFGRILIGASLMMVLTLLFSHYTYAATCGGINTSLIECKEGGDGGIFHLLALALDIMGIGIGILGVVGISWAGIEYLTAGSSEEKTTKAKRRIYEIILGLASYVAIMGLSQWLLPGGVLNPSKDNSGVSNFTITYSGDASVDKAFTPTVSFNDDAQDKTYSLVSSDSEIAVALGRNVKCVSEGSVAITAIAANGTKASIDITCNEHTDASDTGTTSRQSDDNTSSNPAATTGNVANTKLKGKPNLRKETKQIIQDHSKDFYYTGKKSYKKVVLGKKSKYGSYKNYVKSLGGVFTKYADTKRIQVKTAADLQEAAEYVFGLWSIWGPDYSGWTFTPWSGKDAFYRNDPNRKGHPYIPGNPGINKALARSYNKTIDTHCNKSMHVFIKSTSLKFINTGAGKTHIKNKIKESGFYKHNLITNISKLRVGDFMNFQLGGYAGHVVLVGEVYKDYIVVYDGGSRFMRNRNYKFKIKRRNGKSLAGSKYSGSLSWYGYRPWKIDQSVTLKGVN